PLRALRRRRPRRLRSRRRGSVHRRRGCRLPLPRGDAEDVAPPPPSARDRAEPLDALRDEIERTIREDALVTTLDGGIVRPGRSAELDEIKNLAGDAKRYLAELQAKEIARTGIT